MVLLIYMLACDSSELACKWLKKHKTGDYQVVAVFDEAVAAFVHREYGLQNTLECYQAVHTDDNIPECDTDLSIRTADMNDYQAIVSRYDKITPEELQMVIERKELFIGMYNGQMAGFAGRHLEGSIGILEVLPQYRKRGFGKALECFMIKYMKNQGLTAFCQVETDNEVSLGLQRRLGYTIPKEKVYFLY